MLYKMTYTELREINSKRFTKRADRLKKYYNPERARYELEDTSDEFEIEKLETSEIEALRDYFKETKKSDARVFQAIIDARSNKFGKCPRFDAFPTMLENYIKAHAFQGWIYKKTVDGFLLPYLITTVRHDEPRDKRDGPGTMNVYLAACKPGGRNGGINLENKSISFGPSDVSRKEVSDILFKRGYLIGTKELRDQYDEEVAYFRDQVEHGFADQFLISGYMHPNSHREQAFKSDGRKVIHDADPDYFSGIRDQCESAMIEGDDFGEVPFHPVIRVFDLKKHEFFNVHSGTMTPYKWNKNLADNLVLPSSHRDLLNIMTTNLDAFIGDIIEGKSAGNIILCRGVPGVGKTLTAEIYSEIIGKPLYSIHSGSLGTTASDIHRSLETIFDRHERWGCIILLDEADVFVMERGKDVELNAIVAEFLRTLEYFSGLLFMTTNRSDLIDEAIISRCAAIINYSPPTNEQAAMVWGVLLNNFGQSDDPKFINGAMTCFPNIAPRDIKMLLRLALKVEYGKGSKTLSIDTMLKCAMFRDIEIKSIPDDDTIRGWTIKLAEIEGLSDA